MAVLKAKYKVLIIKSNSKGNVVDEDEYVLNHQEMMDLIGHMIMLTSGSFNGIRKKLPDGTNIFRMTYEDGSFEDMVWERTMNKSV